MKIKFPKRLKKESKGLNQKKKKKNYGIYENKEK